MATAPARVFTLPDLGEGLQEAEIVGWHVAEGDHVVADQPLVSVETDKAVVEIPSPRSGRVAKLLAPLHARVPIGAPLVAFSEGAEIDTGAVVGELLPSAPSPPPKPAVRPRATPAVRALANELGVDLATIVGTGEAGEITRADVQRAADARAGAEPLRGVRRAMALRMAEAGGQVVPATVTDQANVDRWPADAPVTAHLIAAVAVACRAEPALNATYDGDAIARRLNAEVHVGVAVDTEDGLIVPVLRDAQRLDLSATLDELARLVAAARTRQLAPETMRGATITVSNFGSLGGEFAALVVVPPQVAILGAGRIEARACVVDGKLCARKMLPLSLTFDHRAVTGGEATRFLAAAKSALEGV